jgi:hypothetical protein
MAQAETIIDNEYATLLYYPDTKIVAHKFHKFFTGRQLRDVLNKGTELLATHGAQKWLSDDRDFTALHPDDREWGHADWNPRTIKAGWKYWAVVVPHDVVGQMSTQRLVETFSELGVEARAFTDPDEAMRWLESK